ncbi:MAG TPA: hypothetical protein VKU02_07465 [Gemmataceae bacterium]|nr:hypothetical protein [Gemmataceae bacterium]
MTTANDPSHTGSSPPVENSTATPPSVPPHTDVPPAAGVGEEERPSIPLPPLPPPPEQTSPEQLAAEIARQDRVLVLVVLALAFLLASVAVRNSDFWMHLATGRLLAHGEYHFGVDPFSYTSTDYWANHAWFFDLILYVLTSLAGGPESEPAGIVLVVLKALLVTLLAWIMVRTRRPGRSQWIPAVCAGLALVAMSPRLLLQPTLISLLFLSLTLYILQKPRHSEEDVLGRGQTPGLPLAVYWLLVPLFVLWVNLDNWFLLGPITLALYLLGQTLQRLFSPIRTGADAPEPSQQRVLVKVLVVGLVACLLNPHHYHAFTLPSQLPLTPAADPLQREDLFRQFFYWLLQDDYLQSAAAWTIAGLAYWPLFVLGLASFAFSLFTGWRWWRFTIWLAFFLLSVYQIRAIPFFAVVAGPITALNWQDVLAARFGTEPRVSRLWKTWALAGRLLTVLAGVALLAGAWSGWLFVSWINGMPASGPQGRRVAWAVDVDPALRKSALQLRTWREQGLLRPEDHGFNYAPDVANYCAWFCPEEKGFLDYRLDLFSRKLAKEFVDLRQSLRGNPPPTGDTARRPADWKELFRDYGISHVVLYGTDTSPLNPGVQNSLQAAVWMLFDPGSWTLIYMDGRCSIFRWNGASGELAPGRPAIPPLDLRTLAFGPQPQRAPATSPEQSPPQRDLAAHWLQRAPVPPLDTDLAARYMGYFNQMQQEWPLAAVAATEIANWSRTVGLAVVGSGTIAAAGTLALDSDPNLFAFFNPRALDFFLRDKSYGPSAAPILAVRAARRGIAESPEYSASFYTLAEAYTMLSGEQEDHWVGPTSVGMGSPPRQKLRQTQILAALEFYITLRPNDGEAHFRLFQMYAQMQYLDLALDHLRVATEALAAAGPGRREGREDFKRRLDQMQQELAKRKGDVKSREDNYQVDARDKPLGAKVNKALQNGLVKRARTLLLEADSAQLGRAEIDLLFDLLLTTGHPDQARAGMTENLRPALGLNYDWYNALIGAACGNYREAGQYLEDYIQVAERTNLEGAVRLLEVQTFRGGLSPGSLYGIEQLPNRVRELADWRVLRGMLAVEEGDNAVAAKFFQEALGTGEREQFRFESRPIAVRYLQLIREAGGAP